MTIPRFILGCALVAALFTSVLKADGDHRPVKDPGPNGGRLIFDVEPHAEFLVLPDRRVQISFVDNQGKTVPLSDQSVTVVAGQRSAPKTLTFSKSGDVFVSNEPLPEGSRVPTVVQIKSTPTAKMVVDKFNVDLAPCGECKLAEYACICGH